MSYLDFDAFQCAALIEASPTRERALRLFIQYSDTLNYVVGPNRARLSLTEPSLTGTPAWDAAIAGLVELRLSEVGLTAPEWTEAPERFLTAPTAPPMSRYQLEADISEVPIEFLRRNVLIERDTLASV